MKCIVLCAGKGSRLGSEIPKVLALVHGVPLLYHVINMWDGLVDELIFVVGYRWQSVVECLPKKSRHVFQETQKGIADAVLQVESLVEDDEFVVALGDCIQKGEWELPLKPFELGVGVWETEDLTEINKSYLVSILPSTGLIDRVIEKPNIEHLTGKTNCGMGTYFFDKRVFDYIRKTPVSSLRNEIEITDTIQLMINSGEKLAPIFFIGDYLNVTYPEDIKKAEEILSE